MWGWPTQPHEKRTGVKAWNEWRDKNPQIVTNLIGVNLDGADLHEVDLSGAYLPEAKLIGVNPVMQISVDLTWDRPISVEPFSLKSISTATLHRKLISD